MIIIIIKKKNNERSTLTIISLVDISLIWFFLTCCSVLYVVDKNSVSLLRKSFLTDDVGTLVLASATILVTAMSLTSTILQVYGSGSKLVYTLIFQLTKPICMCVLVE